jgi:hypothetical protein
MSVTLPTIMSVQWDDAITRPFQTHAVPLPLQASLQSLESERNGFSFEQILAL